MSLRPKRNLTGDEVLYYSIIPTALSHRVVILLCQMGLELQNRHNMPPKYKPAAF